MSDDYIAGFLDSDGSIVATLERYKSARFPYRVRVKVNFTQHIRHRDALATIQKVLGGIGAIRKAASRPIVELVVEERKQVSIVLKRIGPRLHIKRQQAKLALSVLELLSGNEKHKPSNLSDKEYLRVLHLVQEIRSLNANTGGKRTRSELFDPVTTEFLQRRMKTRAIR
jgi:hypothetical protein